MPLGKTSPRLTILHHPLRDGIWTSSSRRLCGFRPPSPIFIHIHAVRAPWTKSGCLNSRSSGILFWGRTEATRGRPPCLSKTADEREQHLTLSVPLPVRVCPPNHHLIYLQASKTPRPNSSCLLLASSGILILKMTCGLESPSIKSSQPEIRDGGRGTTSEPLFTVVRAGLALQPTILDPFTRLRH